MADNRLWLIHRPTGSAVMLGKRFGSEVYYKPPSAEEMHAFFLAAAEQPNEDDFVLAIEDASGAPSCTDKWKYQRVEGDKLRPVLED